MFERLTKKPILKIADDETIQYPTGVLKDQLTGADLRRDSAKHFSLYRSFYENADEMGHEMNTRFKRKGNTVGKNNQLLMKKATNGIVYNIIMGNGKSHSDTMKLAGKRMFSKIASRQAAKKQSEKNASK